METLVRRRLTGLLAVAVWLLVLTRMVQVFSPSSAHLSLPFNSDVAIPILMANDDQPFSPLALYFWGTDRWGTWAYLLPALAHRRLDVWWSPKAIFLLHGTWVLLGALIAGALAPKNRWPIALLYAAVLFLQRDTGYILLNVGQVHGWILTSVLLSWLALRRVFDPPGRPRRAPLLATAAMLLALLSSIASLPLVVALLIFEAARGWAKAMENDRWRRSLAFALGALATAVFFERSLHWLCVREMARHDQLAFLFRPSVDWRHLGQNLSRQLGGLADLRWSPLYLLAAIAALVLLGESLREGLRSRDRARAFAQRLFLSDTLAFALAATGLATIQLGLAVITDWVRYNDHHPRFLAITHQLAPAAALAFLIEPARAQLEKRAGWAGQAVLGLGVIGTFVALPSPRASSQYESAQRIASALAGRAPGGVLLGGYWQTYVFVALQPKDPMTPVQFTYPRTPWTAEALATADEIVVEYGNGIDFEPRPAADRSHPPQHIRPGGHRFRLEEPRWLVDGSYAFARYIRDGDLIFDDDMESTGSDLAGSRWKRRATGSR